MKISILIAAITVFLAPLSFAQTMCPDGSLVSNESECTLATDETFVDEEINLTPEETFIAEDGSMAPDGTLVAEEVTLTPEETVMAEEASMTPDDASESPDLSE